MKEVGGASRVVSHKKSFRECLSIHLSIYLSEESYQLSNETMIHQNNPQINSVNIDTLYKILFN